MKGKAIVLLSGGLDSVTTLYLAREEYPSLTALSFDYGQRHSVELEFSRKSARAAGVTDHRIAHIDSFLFAGSALTDSTINVPGNGSNPDEIPVTYVPARNTLFLAHGLALAESLDADAIFIGANAIDYSGYPDCRPEFLKAFENMATLATKRGIENRPIRILAPLINMTKGEIIRAGLKLGVDYSLTSSCYNPSGDGKPCMVCDSCRYRAKGFEEAGVEDPLIEKFR